MTKNLNTTIDKIALYEFNTHYDQLGDNEKQKKKDKKTSGKNKNVEKEKEISCGTCLC